MSLATTRRDGPGLAEVFGVWSLYALVALAVLVTYTRLPPGELYHVSGEGLGAGLGRTLVFLDYPVALVALGVLPVLLDRLPGPRAAFAGLVAGLLCATVAWPGVVDQGDLDARPVNVLPALGVALVLALTAVAAGRGGRARSVRSAPGDCVRVALAALVALVGVPWIAADLGVGLSGAPVLGDVFLSDEHWAALGEARVHDAVHAGHHHGTDGVLLVLTALLLSRALPEIRAPRLRTGLSVYLGLMSAYGVGNVLNDGWLEQVVKRGWTEVRIPSVTEPAPTPAWLVVLLAAAALHVVVLRRLAPVAGAAGGSRRRPLAAAAPWVGAGAVLAVAAAGAASGGRELSPPFPPPAGRIAFPTVGLRFDVFVLRRDGSLRNVTAAPGRDLAPAWSPSGRRLAVQSSRTGGPRVYTLDADGGLPVPVGDGREREGEPSWSDAGIVFVCGRRICASPGEGRVLADGERPAWPALSPDGERLAWEDDGEGGRDLYLAGPGGSRRVLVGGPADDRFPRWSPDGRWLAFVSDRAGDFDIWVARGDGSSPRRLTGDEGNDYGPAWSPDGRWLAFVSDRDGRDQLYAIRADGSALRRLTSGDTDKEAPSWGRE